MGTLCISHVAGHYRVACSPGSIQANARGFRGKSRTTALLNAARAAGGFILSCAGHRQNGI